MWPWTKESEVRPVPHTPVHVNRICAQANINHTRAWQALSGWSVAPCSGSVHFSSGLDVFDVNEFNASTPMRTAQQATVPPEGPAAQWGVPTRALNPGSATTEQAVPHHLRKSRLPETLNIRWPANTWGSQRPYPGQKQQLCATYQTHQHGRHVKPPQTASVLPAVTDHPVEGRPQAVGPTRRLR